MSSMGNKRSAPGNEKAASSGVRSQSPPGPTPRREVTRLLRLWQDGDREAANRLWPIVQPELKKICQAYLKKERKQATLLQPTELLNEAYIKLVEENFHPFENRLHFFGIAAKILRQILVDRARRRKAQKRGGGHEVYTLREGQVQDEASASHNLLELDEALTELEKVDTRKAWIIELRFFANFTIEEIMQITRLSRTTVNRDLQRARLWLKRFIQGSRKYHF